MRLGDNNFDDFKKIIDDFFNKKTKQEIQELVDKALNKNINTYFINSYYNSNFTIRNISIEDKNIAFSDYVIKNNNKMSSFDEYKLNNTNDSLYKYNIRKKGV